jgi:hypothetical protein
MEVDRKESDMSINAAIDKLDVNSETENKDDIEKLVSSSTSSSGISSSAKTSSTEEEAINEQFVKRKRKRKRHRKRKVVTSCAYESPESFPKRYKKAVDLILSQPRIHLKFDDDGNCDELKSMYNYKPRIIKALSRNLCVQEMFDDLTKNLILSKGDEESVCDLDENTTKSDQKEEFGVSLKPRIIKAIGT